MTIKLKRSEAQIEAEKRHNKKRLKLPTIPAIRLTPEENEKYCEIFNRYKGTKKDAVLKGLDLLDKSLK